VPARARQVTRHSTKDNPSRQAADLPAVMRKRFQIHFNALAFAPVHQGFDGTSTESFMGFASLNSGWTG